MIARHTNTPTQTAVCTRCGHVGTHGTLVAIQVAPGRTRYWYCPSPCLGIVQKLSARFSRGPRL